jgi:ribonuclease J
MSHAEIAKSMGVKKDNVFILKCGDVLEINADEAKIVGSVPSGGVFVDGLGVGDVGNVVLRDRQVLSENGLIAVMLTMNRTTGEVIAGPELLTRGFVYVKESDNLMDGAYDVVCDVLEEIGRRHISDRVKMKGMIRDALGDFVWKNTKRNPMILPVIMEGDD